MWSAIPQPLGSMAQETQGHIGMSLVKDHGCESGLGAPVIQGEAGRRNCLAWGKEDSRVTYQVFYKHLMGEGNMEADSFQWLEGQENKTRGKWLKNEIEEMAFEHRNSLFCF